MLKKLGEAFDLENKFGRAFLLAERQVSAIYVMNNCQKMPETLGRKFENKFKENHIPLFKSRV